MKIATWNVNGIRAREQQLLEWLDAEKPDVLCLQEIKASLDQVPITLCSLEGYACRWHGNKGYSGVALHVRKDAFAEKPEFSHPPFDVEQRVVCARMGNLVVASVYVPNGGKDFAAKMSFLSELDAWSLQQRAAGVTLVICGDLNVALTDRDVHPKELKPKAIGQLPEERERIQSILGNGLVDVTRALHPDADDFFTWWAPWRSLRQKNIGWRIDFILASTALAARAQSIVSQREVGTSDHAPLVAVFGPEA